ncbi:hypothetical protein MLD52_19010 [Puniceicoccaceae bacterium K14]|nr:hypothetical protein [Puniceicoccaceae bacterium K14]
MENTTIFITIGIYLVFLLGIGKLFTRYNSNISDYVRGGARGTWWMVGMSSFMASISAFTFTGNAGAAFQAGPSPIIIYMATNMAGFVFIFFLAGWFRQSRAVTLQDLVRRRFGPEVEQLNCYMAVVLGPLHAAVQLLSLGIFCSAVFGFPLIPTIVVIGCVVVTYSTMGGRWAVMATDFFQSLILIPIVVLIAYLCLKEVGGVSGFLEHFNSPKLGEDYKFINAEGHWPGDRFSSKWMTVIFLSIFLQTMSFIYAPRYLAVRDGKEARKAAMLTFGLGWIGTLIWFIPPMVARFLIEDDVLAVDITQPVTASYALIAERVLPNGLLGVLVVAMFAATMSSMDTGLNGVTGTVVKNLLPPLFRKLKRPPIAEDRQLFWCRGVTLFFGAMIIVNSAWLGIQEEVELFDILLLLGSIIGLPLAIPLAISIFFKRLPRWSYFSISGCSLIPSIWSYIEKWVTGEGWLMHDRIMWILIGSLVGTLLSLPFYRYSKQVYRDQVDKLFKDMRTPIDFEKEIGGANDTQQLRTMGNVSIAGGLFLAILLILPNSLSGRMCVLFVCGFVILIGSLMKRTARLKDEALKVANLDTDVKES